MNSALTHVTRILTGVAALVGLAATQAMAVDLTGTWEGSFACQQFIQGQPKAHFSMKDIQFQISQSVRDLNLQLVNPTTGLPSYFDGIVVDDGVHTTKGQAALLECTSGVQSIGGAMIRARVLSTDPATGKGRLAANIIAADSAPVEQVVTCTVNAKRIDTTDPGVPDCP